MRCSLDDPEDLKYQKLAHDSQSPNTGQRLLNIHDAIQNVDIVVKEGAADKGFRANRNSILGQQLASNSSVAARVKARHTMQLRIFCNDTVPCPRIVCLAVFFTHNPICTCI